MLSPEANEPKGVQQVYERVPVSLSSSYFTFEPRGISMTALKIPGGLSPVGRSCQGWEAEVRLLLILFDAYSKPAIAGPANVNNHDTVSPSRRELDSQQLGLSQARPLTAPQVLINPDSCAKLEVSQNTLEIPNLCGRCGNFQNLNGPNCCLYFRHRCSSRNARGCWWPHVPPGQEAP